jgi:hypothetical protein
LVLGFGGSGRSTSRLGSSRACNTHTPKSSSEEN